MTFPPFFSFFFFCIIFSWCFSVRKCYWSIFKFKFIDPFFSSVKSTIKPIKWINFWYSVFNSILSIYFPLTIPFLWWKSYFGICESFLTDWFFFWFWIMSSSFFACPIIFVCWTCWVTASSKLYFHLIHRINLSVHCQHLSAPCLSFVIVSPLAFYHFSFFF